MSGFSMIEAWASKNTQMAIECLLPEDTERIRTAVLNSLEEGCSQGEGRLILADRVQKILQSSRDVAIRVADNVVGAVLSESRYTGALSAGMTHKIWICPHGPFREIGGHRDAEKKYSRHPCPIEEPFVVTGVALRFPRDYTTGHPEQCIGCQCLAIAKRV
jgi:hypothetical protein